MSVDFLIKCAENRLFSIETELTLLEKQILSIPKVPGNNLFDANLILLEYNICFVIRKYLALYLSYLKNNYKDRCSFNESIALHISALENMSISSFLFEIAGHQIALSDITQTTLRNNGGTPEGIIIAIKRFFPFDMVLPLLQNAQFFSKLLSFVCDDLSSSTTNSFSNQNKLVNNILSLFTYNELDKYIFIVVSEVIVSYFKPLNNHSSYKDYLFFEKCNILMKNEFNLLPIKSMKTYNYHNENLKDGENLTLRKFVKAVDRPSLFDEAIETNEIPFFLFIKYEIQKICIHNSISMICVSLLQTSEFLSRAISAIEGNSQIGADESFHVLIYIICSAKISNFVTIADNIDRFCFNFLKVSKIGYIIEQLKSVEEFINSLEIKSPQKILSPFLSQPNAVKKEISKFSILLYPDEVMPAIFKYTGNEGNKVFAYVQDFDKSLYQFDDIEIISTMKGLVPIYKGENDLEVIDGDYEKYIACLY